MLYILSQTPGVDPEGVVWGGGGGTRICVWERFG